MPGLSATKHAALHWHTTAPVQTPLLGQSASVQQFPELAAGRALQTPLALPLELAQLAPAHSCSGPQSEF